MDRLSDERGLTLAELLVVLAVTGLLLAGALAIQQSGFSLYLFGSSRVETLENTRFARFALARMAREMQTASLVSSTSLSASDLQFSGLDGAGNAVTIRYQLVGSDLRRTEGANAAENVIGGVEALTFTYRSSTDTITTAASAVRRIDITLRARTEQAGQAGSAQAATSEVTTTVRLRNAL